MSPNGKDSGSTVYLPTLLVRLHIRSNILNTIGVTPPDIAAVAEIPVVLSAGKSEPTAPLWRRARHMAGCSIDAL